MIVYHPHFKIGNAISKGDCTKSEILIRIIP